MRESGPIARGLAALALVAGLAGSFVGCGDASKKEGAEAATDAQQQQIQGSMKDFMAKKGKAR